MLPSWVSNLVVLKLTIRDTHIAIFPYSGYKSHRFETSRDLTARRLIRYWKGTLVPCVLRSSTVMEWDTIYRQCCPKTVARSQNATHKCNGQPIFAPWVVRFATNKFPTDFSQFNNCVYFGKNTPIALKFHRQLGTTGSGPPIKFQNDWRTLNRNLVRPRLNEILGYTPWWWWKTNDIELRVRSHYKGFIVISGWSVGQPTKVQNSGSPNGPPMVYGWVVRITFGWSEYAVVRNDDKTLIWLLCCLFSAISRGAGCGGCGVWSVGVCVCVCVCGGGGGFKNAYMSSLI